LFRNFMSAAKVSEMSATAAQQQPCHGAIHSVDNNCMQHSAAAPWLSHSLIGQ